jgi:hypothetical protein
VSSVTEVRVTRSRDVLEGQILPVTGRLRRHGRLELLVVLPDGTSRLIPQAWTDNGDGDGGGPGAAGATLGPVSDLLASCVLVAALRVRAAGTLEQAARKSPCKEDNRAACAAQSAAGTGSGTSPDGFVQLPSQEVTTAIRLLARLIARSAGPALAAPAGTGDGDE